MKSIAIKLLLSISVLFVLGCSSKWESSASVSTQGTAKAIVYAQAPQDSSYIYVYREEGFQGSLAAWFVKYDEKKELKIKNGSYILIKTTPGVKTLIPTSTTMGSTDEELTFQAKAGQSYFLKLDYHGFWVPSLALFLQDNNNKAMSMLSSYELVNIYEDYKPDRKHSINSTDETCSAQSQNPNCYVSVEEVIGKVIINRQNKGFRAKPGIKLEVDDKIITDNTGTLYFLLYGEPKMVKPNTTYKVKIKELS